MISERLKRMLLKELNLDDFIFTDDTVASDVPGWDSLNHARILCAVEEEFGLRFRTLEVLRLKNLGELQALIEKKSSH
jgi:acyl carrier protein